jgi:hypothetical protein
MPPTSSRTPTWPNRSRHVSGGDAEDDEYTVHADAVNETTDEKIRLREEL